MANRKITIRFSVDKNGKRRAHYWGLARRWLPISVDAADAAELKLATGDAVPSLRMRLGGCSIISFLPSSSVGDTTANYVHTSREGDVWSV